MRKLIALSVASLMFTSIGVAQEKTEQKVDQNQKAASQQDEGQQKQADKKAKQYVSSNKMIGAYIYNAEEEAIADINTIVLDAEGNPHFVIAGVGGVAGVGETEIAIPYKALKCECKMKDGETVCHASISMTKEKLENAPAIDSEKYEELTDKNWLKTNAEFYSAEAPEKALQPAQMICVATVTDLDVEGSNGESVGHLDAVVFDVASSKAVFGIIGDGGTVGLNEKYVAVPFKSLQFKQTSDGDPEISINATPEKVKQAPGVTPSEYPELDLESVRGRIDSSVTSNE